MGRTLRGRGRGDRTTLYEYGWLCEAEPLAIRYIPWDAFFKAEFLTFLQVTVVLFCICR